MHTANLAGRVLCPKHTESVEFTPCKSLCKEQYISSILAHALNQRVVYLERPVESLAVCMPQMDNKCANYYANTIRGLLLIK